MRIENREGNKELIHQQIISDFNGMGSKDVKMVKRIVQFDLIKDLVRVFRNLDTATKSAWQTVLTKLKNYKKLFGDDDFNKKISELLPVLGAYLGAMFTFQCNKEKEAEAALPFITLPNGEETDDPKQVSALIDAMNAGGINALGKSAVLGFCERKENGFSFVCATDDNTQIAEESDASCRISLCVPETSTNIEALASNLISEPKGMIIEYDESYPRFQQVSVGQTISFMDYIGHINGIPVKSHVHGVVTEKTEQYFALDYVNDAEALDLESLVSSANTDDFDEICQMFSDNSNAVNFIKDYLPYTRIPHLAAHVREHVFGAVDEVATSTYIKKYRKKIDKIKEEYEKETKQKCSKDNISAYAKKSKLLRFKEEIDEDRRNAFERIIDVYRHYDSLGYCSKGRIADYMICDEYLSYITDSELFRYDDNNPYVVKLFKLICKFIGIRSRIEHNSENIPSLIDDFNSLCKKSLKKFWKPSDNDYYTKMKSVFLYEYYTNDVDAFIEAAVTDKDAVSLYKKVYEYLKTLCGYVTPEAEEIEYSEDIDVESILKSGKSSEVDLSFDNDLKKIAANFCMLRIIETNAEDEASFRMVATESNVTAFYRLHNISGILIEEYKDNYLGIDPIVIANTSVLKPYLKTLKNVTGSEITQLNALMDECLSWYSEKGEQVNDPAIFDRFKEIAWYGSTTVYKDGEKYDFTYLKYEDFSVNNMQAIADAEPFDFEESENDDYYYDSLNCLKSAYGPNNMLYWLRYLTLATLVNCMLPIYWGTGIIISGVSVILPIVMLPIFVLPGRVTVVFGIGLCGICPLPLILFCNMSNTASTILLPLNILADTIKTAAKQVVNQEKKAVELAYSPVLQNLDREISQCDSEISKIDDQIHNIDSFVKNNKTVLRTLKRLKKEDPTTMNEKRKLF